MTQSNQNQGIKACHEQLLAKIEEAQALAHQIVKLLPRDEMIVGGVYVDISIALHLQEKRARLMSNLY
tara:strand:+ start:82 stop:285 length:204 start_codon:yes stop_codon:yes gene_type:complete